MLTSYEQLTIKNLEVFCSRDEDLLILTEGQVHALIELHFLDMLNFIFHESQYLLWIDWMDGDQLDLVSSTLLKVTL